MGEAVEEPQEGVVVQGADGLGQGGGGGGGGGGEGGGGRAAASGGGEGQGGREEEAQDQEEGTRHGVDSENVGVLRSLDASQSLSGSESWANQSRESKIFFLGGGILAGFCPNFLPLLSLSIFSPPFPSWKEIQDLSLDFPHSTFFPLTLRRRRRPRKTKCLEFIFIASAPPF